MSNPEIATEAERIPAQPHLISVLPDQVIAERIKRLIAVSIDDSPEFDPKVDPTKAEFLAAVQKAIQRDEMPRVPARSNEWYWKKDPKEPPNRLEKGIPGEFSHFMKKVLEEMAKNGDYCKGQNGFKGLSINATFRSLMLLRVHGTIDYFLVAQILLQFAYPLDLTREYIITITNHLADNYNWKKISPILDAIQAKTKLKTPRAFSVGEELVAIQESEPSQHLGGPIKAPTDASQNYKTLDIHVTYPTDLTDDEWKKIEIFVSSGLGPSLTRQVVNALLYHEATGCPLNQLPEGFPVDWASSLYDYWKRERIWSKIKNSLRRLKKLSQ